MLTLITRYQFCISYFVYVHLKRTYISPFFIIFIEAKLKWQLFSIKTHTWVYKSKTLRQNLRFQFTFQVVCKVSSKLVLVSSSKWGKTQFSINYDLRFRKESNINFEGLKKSFGWRFLLRDAWHEVSLVKIASYFQFCWQKTRSQCSKQQRMHGGGSIQTSEEIWTFGLSFFILRVINAS